jgi:hypothetical protein
MTAKLTAQQKRDRRAKMMLGVLGLVLLAVLGFELPKYVLHHSPKSAASASATGAGTGPSLAATTGIPGVTAAAGVTPAELQLAATPQSDLTRFSRFGPNDPFRARVVATVESGGGSVATTTSTHAATTSAPPAKVAATIAPTTTTTTGVTAKPPSVLLPAAVLTLDGKTSTIVVGTAFPAGKPLFRLAAVGRGSMWISLVHGSFGGQPLLRIARGHPVELVDQAGKASYLLGLLRVTATRVLLQAHASTGTTATTTTTAATTTVTVGTGTTPPPTTTASP